MKKALISGITGQDGSFLAEFLLQKGYEVHGILRRSSKYKCSIRPVLKEDERRGETFVTRKITLAAARIAQGEQDKLYLGNLDAKRDWGYAKDYVECMWLIMQQENPEDFVIATGVQHTVRDFTEKAFAANGMTIRWEGTGIDEKGYDAATGKLLVCVNPQWFRPTDVDNLWGDPTKAKTVLGWNPQKTSYEELVEIMAKHDRELAKREKAMKAVM